MLKRILPIIAVVVVLGLSVLVYMFLRVPEEASAPIEAVPLATTAPSLAESTTSDSDVGATDDAAANDDPADAPVDDDEAAAADDTAAEPTLTVYEISPNDSIVRFQLDEDLRGERVTVVGESNQVSGQIAIDLANLGATQVGVIQVNARTLATNNDFRNRAIQNQILDTGAYEFIVFTTTSIEGLPESAVVGETIEFSLVGDLTIRDVTTEATFTVSAMVDELGQLSGSATTVVTRAAYNLIIPSVPNVANVEDEVELTIDFVAPPFS